MPGARGLSLADRFWSKVDRSGGPDACWLWLRAVDKDGYGTFQLNGKQRAHHIAFYLAHGHKHSAEVLRHSCDVSGCVNPAHLVEGTTLDNVADRVARGRTRCGSLFPKGEKHPQAKLTADQVRAIREAPPVYGSRIKLAAQFGVSVNTIQTIRARNSWRHL